MSTYTKWGVLGFLWLANPIYFTGCFGRNKWFRDQANVGFLMKSMKKLDL